jgi:hypothetical protein
MPFKIEQKEIPRYWRSSEMTKLGVHDCKFEQVEERQIYRLIVHSAYGDKIFTSTYMWTYEQWEQSHKDTEVFNQKESFKRNHDDNILLMRGEEEQVIEV